MSRPRDQARRMGGGSGPMRALVLAWALVLSTVACSDSGSTSGDDGASVAEGSDAATMAVRPSIALIVVESLRADAVASFGAERGSPLPLEGRSATPHLDALSDRGVRYALALAASPSTVTSHASLLSGLPPVEHGAGLWTEVGVPASVEMLAQSLAEAGYETVGFSENPMAGPDFGLDRGFERFESPRPEDVAARLAEGDAWTREFRLVQRVEQWLKTRDRRRPYFLFVNLADPHLPFARRESHPFLDPKLPARLVDHARGGPRPQFRICRELPDPESLGILAGLYLEGVAAADRKLGTLGAMLAEGAPRPPITVVTADHGAHFGESSLVGHAFAVDERALHVPLVVVDAPSSGPPAIADGGAARSGPGRVVETPVAQWRIADSMRCWAGLASACPRGLPVDEEAARVEPARPIVSIAGNETRRTPPAAVVDTGSLHGDALWASAHCPLESGFSGRLVSWVAYPHKLVWRQIGPPSLFDLSWDPHERSDQIRRAGPHGEALLAEVEAFVQAHRLDRVHREATQAPLAERVADAYLAGRRAFLAEEEIATDVVWFGQLILEDRADPALQAWVERQRPLHVDDPYYPIIDPTAVSSLEVPPVLPRGLGRFAAYLLAAVGGPDDVALPHLDDYLVLEDTDGYVLSHQVSALGWALALGRALPAETRARMPGLLARMAAEHGADDRFRDLWAERAAFLTVFGEARDDDLEDWSEVIVEHHLGEGDWGHTATAMGFDGETKVGQHPRAHVRGLSMIVLSRYLARLGDPGLPSPLPDVGPGSASER